MFYTGVTGIDAAAQGIKTCAERLRWQFPKASLIVVKILPCHSPGIAFYEDIKKTNAALDKLNLPADPMIHVMDLWNEMTNPDGTIKRELFQKDNIHLNADKGYLLYADKIRPLLEKLLGKGGGKPPEPSAPPVGSGMIYPYQPYHEGKMDPQISGWPISDAEKDFIFKGEYTRKPGHESHLHLPEMWAVVPTAATWGDPAKDGKNIWLENHVKLVEDLESRNGGVDLLFIGDSITQYMGGGGLIMPNGHRLCSWSFHNTKF